MGTDGPISPDGANSPIKLWRPLGPDASPSPVGVIASSGQTERVSEAQMLVALEAYLREKLGEKFNDFMDRVRRAGLSPFNEDKEQFCREAGLSGYTQDNSGTGVGVMPFNNEAFSLLASLAYKLSQQSRLNGPPPRNQLPNSEQPALP